MLPAEAVKNFMIRRVEAPSHCDASLTPIDVNSAREISSVFSGHSPLTDPPEKLAVHRFWFTVGLSISLAFDRLGVLGPSGEAAVSRKGSRLAPAGVGNPVIEVMIGVSEPAIFSAISAVGAPRGLLSSHKE